MCETIMVALGVVREANHGRPHTEAGESPQCVLWILFSRRRGWYFDFSRKWVGEDTGIALLWGLQSKHRGTVIVYNGVDSKISEGQ